MTQGGHGSGEPEAIGGENVAEAGGERSDGRPAGVPGGADVDPEGRPEIARNAPVASSSGGAAPTEPPEEQGEEPATEHSPGSDL